MKIGFGEIGLTLIVSILAGYIFHRFKIIYDRRKRQKNIPKKIEERSKKPINIGGKNYKLDPVEIDPEEDIIRPEDLKIPKPSTSKKKIIRKPSKKKKKKIKK